MIQTWFFNMFILKQSRDQLAGTKSMIDEGTQAAWSFRAGRGNKDVGGSWKLKRWEIRKGDWNWPHLGKTGRD